MSGFWKEHKDVAQTGMRYKRQRNRQAHMSGSRTEALVLMKWSELVGLPFPFLEYKSILNPSSSV